MPVPQRESVLLRAIQEVFSRGFADPRIRGLVTVTGIQLSDAGGTGQWISNNHIQVMYGNQYHAKGHCTGLRLGDPGSMKIVLSCAAWCVF